MTQQPKECPSYGAYQRHVKTGEEPCEGCKQSRRDYERDYRKAGPRARRSATSRDKAIRRAEARARRTLARRYRVAYQALLAKELAKEGITT